MTEQEPVGFDDVEFVEDDHIEWPEVENVEFDVITNIGNIKSVDEGLDILAATFGRFGIEGFTIQIRDADNPERSWVLRGGKLYTTEEFIGEFEYLVDRYREQKDVLSPEEIEALEKADAPAQRE
jgi:hypothetical protein